MVRPTIGYATAHKYMFKKHVHFEFVSTWTSVANAALNLYGGGEGEANLYKLSKQWIILSVLKGIIPLEFGQIRFLQIYMYA